MISFSSFVNWARCLSECLAKAFERILKIRRYAHFGMIPNDLTG